MAEPRRVIELWDLPEEPDRIGDLYRGRVGTQKQQGRERDRIDWLVSQARGEVLDLGCSQGIAAILCARRGLCAVGIDIDADAIETARGVRERRPPEIRERLAFEVGDAAALDVPDDSFDTVLIGNLLHLLDDFAPVVAEVARALRPGGTVAVTVPFGFRPDAAHRTTFFAASLVDALAPHLTVDSVGVADGYLRAIAGPGAMEAGARLELIARLQPQLETWLTELHADLWQVRHLRRKLAHRVREFDRKLAKRRWDARRARWELERLRVTRPWRLRQALAAARRPGGLAGLPRGIAAALRRQPPPPKPKRPKRLLKQLDELSEASSKHAELTAGADRELRIEVPEIGIPAGPIARPRLKAAVILDRFSATAFRYEWDQIQFGPDDWRSTLDRERPDLLFCESAWRGNDDRWREIIVGRDRPAKAPLIELLEWCRAEGIPTVFWNKEDPPNFSHFVASAAHFDRVFTVDGETIPRYAEVIGREDVEVLQFAAQPRIHNPIAVPGGRQREVAFAGTYFSLKHPDRRVQMETVLAPAREFGLEIFSRIIQGEDPRFDWPPEYQPHIVGSLPYERMLAAYKVYKLFLNVNSVIDSPTMCARRVFELSACATPVLSGWSRAIEATFGELIAVSQSQDETRELLAELLGDDEAREQRAQRAMREVMSHHTYSKRVEQVLRAVGLGGEEPRPAVSVLACADSLADVDRAIATARAQAQPLELGLAVGADAGAADDVTRRAREAGRDAIAVEAGDSPPMRVEKLLGATHGELVAVIDPGASYGEHYLTDLVHAREYADAPVVGKLAGREHEFVEELDPAAVLVERRVIERLGLRDVADPAADLVRRAAAEETRVYAADRFSYRPAGDRAQEPAPG